MPRIALKSLGSIPNHKLLKNLQLQGNYISNDGESEGILVSDTGLVTVSGDLQVASNMTIADNEIDISSGNFLLDVATDISFNAGGGDVDFQKAGMTTAYGIHMFLDYSSTNILWIRDPGDTSDDGIGSYLSLQTTTHGASTIKTVDDGGLNAADLTIDAEGTLDLNANGDITFDTPSLYNIIIDKDNIGISTATYKALEIAYDHTSNTLSGNTITNQGIDLNLNSDAGTHVGSVINVGLDMDIVGDTSGGGTTNTGIDIKCTGAGNNYGMNITVPDESGDYHLKLMSSDDVTDYATIAVAAAGATTLTTVDTTVGATAHLTVAADGHVEFDGCGVGFDLVEPTYNSLTTVVDFRTGNKQLVTFDGGDITNLSMYFPATSGNFVVLVKQDGTGGRTIDNYRTYDVDVGNVNSVRFPGAVAPDLTDDANFVDIISVFWDADNFLAYGVATLDFDPT